MKSKKRKDLMERYQKATKQVSLNQLNGSLSSAVYAASPSGQYYASQSESYPKSWYLDDVILDENLAIVCADGMHYSVPYTVADDGSVSIEWGKQEQVIQKWVPVSS